MSSRTSGEETSVEKSSSKSPISVAELPKEEPIEQLVEDEQLVADELHSMQEEAREHNRKKHKAIKRDMENDLYNAIDEVFRNKLLSFKDKDNNLERKNLMHCIKKDIVSRHLTKVCEDDPRCRRSPGFGNYCIPVNKKLNPKSKDNIEEAKRKYLNYLMIYLMKKKALTVEDFLILDKFKDHLPTHDELQEIINTRHILRQQRDDFTDEIERQKKEEDNKVKGGKKKTRRKTTKRKRRKTHRK